MAAADAIGFDRPVGGRHLGRHHHGVLDRHGARAVAGRIFDAVNDSMRLYVGAGRWRPVRLQLIAPSQGGPALSGWMPGPDTKA